MYFKGCSSGDCLFSHLLGSQNRFHITFHLNNEQMNNTSGTIVCSIVGILLEQKGLLDGKIACQCSSSFLVGERKINLNIH